MKEAIAIQIRGWTKCESAEAIALELLGQQANRHPINSVSGRWRIEDPIASDHPVGPVKSLVTFESDAPLEIQIVPGSQGQRLPPEEIGHEVICCIVQPGKVLALDARCWYQVAKLAEPTTTLWLYSPVSDYL